METSWYRSSGNAKSPLQSAHERIRCRPMVLFGWWRAAGVTARRAFVAAALGWGLDAFDFMLWALVVATLIPVFGMSKTTVGLMGSIALLGAEAGGVLFGLIADRYGRTRALMGSILLYSIFTAACGLAP